jgi:hypothetical protein
MLTYRYPGSWSSDGYRSLCYINTYPNPKEPGKLAEVGSLHSCREFFVRTCREKINENGGFTPWVRKAYCLLSYGKPQRLSMVKSWNDILESDVEKGVYITNSFEKAHGWPLTKMYQVETSSHNGGQSTGVFIVGPRKWTTSPYLMSIWSLTIRLGRNGWLPRKLLTLDHENLVRQVAIAAAAISGGDGHQLCTIREWDTFLTLYKDLFGGISRKYHWNKTHMHGVNDRPEGIMKLMKGGTGYKALADRYAMLKKERKLK